MHKSPKVFAVVLVWVVMLLGFLYCPQVSLAQESPQVDSKESPQEGVQEATDLIFERESHSAEIQELLRTYRGQLAEYRTAENEYKLAKEQYLKLRTLSALEEGVTSTKKAMLIRSQVFSTYVSLSKLQLVEATGVSVTQKQALLTQLDQLLLDLATHQATVNSITDKTSLATAALSFTQMTPSLSTTCGKVVALVAAAKLQVIADKETAVLQDMKASFATAATPVKQAELDRAHNEVRELLEETKAQLFSYSQEVYAANNYSVASAESSANRSLTILHSNLARALNYLQEIKRLAQEL